MPRDGTDRPPTRAETASYIAQMQQECEQLARRAGLDVLAYLLGMSRLEAADLALRHQADAVLGAGRPGDLSAEAARRTR